MANVFKRLALTAVSMLLVVDSSSSDDELEGNIGSIQGRSHSINRTLNRPLLHSSTPFQMLHGNLVRPDEFRSQLRVTQDTFEYLEHRLDGELRPQDKSFRVETLSTRERLTLFLLRVGTAGENRGISFHYHVSRSTVSLNLLKVASAIIKVFQTDPQPGEKAIRYPQAAEMNTLMSLMFAQRGVPECWGSFDCKLFKIRGGADDRCGLKSRKGGRAINVGAVSQMNGLFATVTDFWGGTDHDSNVLEYSKLAGLLDEEKLVYPESYCCRLDGTLVLPFITVDAAFKMRGTCLKPYVKPRHGRLSPEEELFNKLQSSARQDIERAWGMLVNRFLIFSKELPFTGENHLERAGVVILACMILHNICVRRHEEEFEGPGFPESEDEKNDDDDDEEEEEEEGEDGPPRAPTDGAEVRRALTDYFGRNFFLQNKQVKPISPGQVEPISFFKFSERRLE